MMQKKRIWKKKRKIISDNFSQTHFFLYSISKSLFWKTLHIFRKVFSKNSLSKKLFRNIFYIEICFREFCSGNLISETWFRKFDSITIFSKILFRKSYFRNSEKFISKMFWKMYLGNKIFQRVKWLFWNFDGAPRSKTSFCMGCTK